MKYYHYGYAVTELKTTEIMKHKTNTTKNETPMMADTILTLNCTMSQNGQRHFKNLVVFAARFLKCVWPFWDIMH